MWKKTKILLLVCLMLIVSFFSFGCDFGINDIPPGMLPGNEEEEDTLIYLAGMLIDTYKDTIINELKSALLNEVENGTLDELFDSQLDSILEKLFEDNKDTLLQEMKDLLKSQSEGTNEFFSDEEILSLIRENLIDNGTLRDELYDDLFLALTDSESEFTQKLISELIKNDDFIDELIKNQALIDALATNPAFIEALVGNKAFVDAIITNTYFLQMLTDIIAGMLPSYP